MSAFHSLLDTYATHKQTVVTLKIHNSGLDRPVTAHFWPFVNLVCVSTDTSGTPEQDQLTHRCVKLRRQVFLNFTAEPYMMRIDRGFVSANTNHFTLCVDQWFSNFSAR